MFISSYKMKVGMFSCLSIILHCKFYYDNSIDSAGFYVEIEGKEFLRERYILGYFDIMNELQQIDWLEKWAKNYWNGKDDTWIIKSLEIEKE